MRSISNNLLASEQPTVKQMTDNSVQELNRLQAVAAALQERPDDEIDTTELDEYEEDYSDEEQLLAELDEDSFEEDDYISTSDDETSEYDEYLEEDGFEEEETIANTVEEAAEQLPTDDELLDEYYEGAFDDDEQVIDVQPAVTETVVITEEAETIEGIEDTYGEDDGFLDEEEIDTDIDYEDEDGFEDDYVEEDEEPITITAAPKPIVSAPLLPPGLRPAPVVTQNVESQNDKEGQGLFDEDDLDDGFDDQDEETEYTDTTSDMDEQILMEMDDGELYDDIYEDGAPKIDDSFEKVEPVAETPSKIKNFENFTNPTGADVDIEDDFSVDATESELDLSLLDDVPMISETPKVNDNTAALEAENARLREQLAKLENARLNEQIATAKKENAVSVTKAGIASLSNKTSEKDTQSERLEAYTEAERKQRQRWAKYAALSTQDLWKYVYKFMSMAGVTKAPVKAKILIEEFGSHNIKRLEATYIMATKDGYTC